MIKRYFFLTSKDKKKAFNGTYPIKGFLITIFSTTSLLTTSLILNLYHQPLRYCRLMSVHDYPYLTNVNLRFLKVTWNNLSQEKSQKLHFLTYPTLGLGISLQIKKRGYRPAIVCTLSLWIEYYMGTFLVLSFLPISAGLIPH